MKEMNGTAREVAMRRAGAGEDQLTIDNSRGLLADPVLLIHFLPRLYYSTHYPGVADVLCHSSSVSLSYSCSECFLHFFSLLPVII